MYMHTMIVLANTYQEAMDAVLREGGSKNDTMIVTCSGMESTRKLRGMVPGPYVLDIRDVTRMDDQQLLVSEKIDRCFRRMWNRE